ncbi:hypothetical protein J7K55_05170 [Candidatus Aerophobetes bacterium]|nr:hypothetical protein [Candidatus Aerophobetes bacterium]
MKISIPVKLYVYQNIPQIKVKNQELKTKGNIAQSGHKNVHLDELFLYSHKKSNYPDESTKNVQICARGTLPRNISLLRKNL